LCDVNSVVIKKKIPLSKYSITSTLTTKDRKTLLVGTGPLYETRNSKLSDLESSRGVIDEFSDKKTDILIFGFFDPYLERVDNIPKAHTNSINSLQLINND